MNKEFHTTLELEISNGDDTEYVEVGVDVTLDEDIISDVIIVNVEDFKKYQMVIESNPEKYHGMLEQDVTEYLAGDECSNGGAF
jgi:hypothetical protein